MSSLPWMQIAWSEADGGVKGVAGPEHNPRIIEYHQATSLNATDDETPWCGSFVAHVMKTAGIAYDKKSAASARSWLGFGEELDEPISGCLVIFRRGSGGHVGFLVKDDGERLHILGGNQGNRVKVSSYKKADALGYRWPTEYPLPGPKPMLKSRTVWATATTTTATIIGGANSLSGIGAAVKDAADNVTAATTGILGIPVWVWPLIGLIAGSAVLFLLWQDRHKGARE